MMQKDNKTNTEGMSPNIRQHDGGLGMSATDMTQNAAQYVGVESDGSS